MLLKEFPDIHWLKDQISKNFSGQTSWNGGKLEHTGWPTVLLNTKTSYTSRENIKGTLSVFSNVNGESYVKTGSKTVRLTPGKYYITNQEQDYSLYVDQHELTETFNIHFGSNFINEIVKDLVNGVNQDSLEPTKNETSFEFHNMIHEHTPESQNIAQRLNFAYKSSLGNNLLQNEVLKDLMLHLLYSEEKIKGSMNSVPVLKLSNKIELGKRLINVVDYMHTYYNKNLTVDDLAELAYLSKFHFLRMFKGYYGQSPHQILTKIRLTRAQEMLRSTSKSAAEIALNIGLNNASSLTRLFHQKVGMSPSVYRTEIRK